MSVYWATDNFVRRWVSAHRGAACMAWLTLSILIQVVAR